MLLNGEKILSRLSPVGIVLMVVGAALCYMAKPLAKRVLKTESEKTVNILKFAGLGLVAMAALVIMDLF